MTSKTVFCAGAGIKHQHKAPHTPEQNAVGESRNRSRKMAKHTLHEIVAENFLTRSSKNSWHFLQNQLPTKAWEETNYI